MRGLIAAAPPSVRLGMTERPDVIEPVGQPDVEALLAAALAALCSPIRNNLTSM
jgi:hypothetical protein